jgi:hypothetical protein
MRPRTHAGSVKTGTGVYGTTFVTAHPTSVGDVVLQPVGHLCGVLVVQVLLVLDALEPKRMVCVAGLPSRSSASSSNTLRVTISPSS